MPTKMSLRAIALMSFALAAAADADQVFITEIMYHPADGMPEFLEIRNATATPFDLAGWTFDDGVSFTFPPFSAGDPEAGFLQAFETVVVASVDEAAFRAAYPVPPTTRVFGPWTGALNNAGERVTLSDKNGLARCTVEYEDGGRWPLAADGTGHSLVLVSDHRPADDWRNWRASTTQGGTPGGPEITSATEPYPNPEVDLSSGLPLFGFGHQWRYHNLGQDLGTAWRTPGYNEATNPGWQGGPGILGFESSGLPAPGLQTNFESEPGFDRAGRLTYYYRTTFQYTGDTEGATVSLDQIIDDGVIYYLNGTEIGRVGMPGGTVTASTTASRTVGDGTEELNAITFSNAPLVEGTNVLAAEVHQTNTTSSDSVFAVRFKVALPTTTDLVINEVLPGAAGEGFVEIFNPTGAPITLDGYYLSDDPNTLTMTQVSGAGPVPSGGFATVGYAESGFGFSDPTRLYLTAPDGSTIADAIDTSMPLDGRSLGRRPAGSGAWFLFVSPTPGLANQSGAELGSALRLNEVGFDAEGGVAWVEVLNAGGAAASLDGVAVSAQRDFSDAVALSGSVGALGYASADVALPPSGGRVTLFLTDAAGTVIDEAELWLHDTRAVHQAFPDGSGEWFSSAAPTRDGANDPARETRVVINEIMFAPPSEHREGEFIELHNRGSGPVDVSGWEFTEGVSFTFPQGTTIGAGGFLVVAADAAFLTSAYGALPVVGDYGGRLRDPGEMLRLVDADGNLIDEVDYRSGVDWPFESGGEGSSMELVHPDLDNSLPSAWRASDESQRSQWQTFTVTGAYRQLRAEGAASDYKELHLHLVGDSHIALRNLSLQRNGSGSNLLPGGGTSVSTDGTGTNGWLVQGTHAQSHNDGGELHLVADGHGDNRANRAEIDIVSVNANDNLTFTFDARWVSGLSRLIVQTWDHSFGQPVEIPIPQNLGTPGSVNSRAGPAPPQLDALAHQPPVPAPGDPVTVSALVASAEPLAAVEAVYRLDNSNGNGPWLTAPMSPAGEGRYAATLNGFTSQGNVVQFYVRAETQAGTEAVLPRRGAAHPAMWVVDNGSSGTDLRTTRFVVSQYDIDAIGQSDNMSGKYGYRYPRLSNHYKNATLIIDERDIIYNAEIRHSGSPWTRGNNLSRGKWKCPPDNRFRGRLKNAFDNDAGNSSQRHHNRLIRHFLYLLGHEQNEGEFVRFIVNSGSPQLREEVEPVAGDLIRRNWDDGNLGELYRIDDQWWFRDDWGRSPENATWRHKSTDDPIRYHTEWIKRSREQEHDFTALIDFFRLVQPASGSPTYTQDQIERFLDPEAVALMAAVRGYAHDWDSFTLNRGKNGYFYRRPADGKFQFLWWDSDLAFRSGDVNSAFYNGMAGFRPWVERPYNLRRFYYYLSRIIDDYSHNSPRMEAWLDAEEASSTSYTVAKSSYLAWFSGREGPAVNAMSSGFSRAFEITTNGGNPTSTAAATIALAGNQPYRVWAVRVANHPEATFATSGTTGWTLSDILLAEGQNELVVEALDHNGDVVGTDTIAVTKIGNGTPVLDLAADPAPWRVPVGGLFDLDGSGSRDPEGAPLTFSWSATGEGSALVGPGDQPQASFTFNRPGLFEIFAHVSDPEGAFSFATREVAVYAPDGFSSFGDDWLEPSWSAANLAVRGNTVAGSPYYTLQDFPGELQVVVEAGTPRPFVASAPGHAMPWLHRALPTGDVEWAMETEVSLDTRQFGDFESGLMVEYVTPGGIGRHFVGIRDGMALSSSSGDGPALAEGRAWVRLHQSGGTLDFAYRREPGDWATFRSVAVPAAEATAVRAGPFVASSSGQGLRASFDYVVLVDPNISTTVRDSLRVTEVMADPEGGSGTEFVELTNTGAGPIDLAGIRFEDGSPFAALTLPSFLLAPGARAVVVSDLAVFEAAFGTDVPVVAVWASGKLDNAGERIVLRDASGTLVQDFSYPAARPGASWEVVDTAGDYGDLDNWRAGVEFGGSPGAAGMGSDRRVVVNEVLAHTDLPSVDSIELYNRTGDPIDIGGWYLSDSTVYRKFRIPDATSLPAGGYLVFDETHFNPTPAGPEPHHFALNSTDGDDVFLVEADAAGNLLAFVDVAGFGASANGESFGLWPDGGEETDLVPMAARSLGAPNPGPRIGPLFISEIHYHDAAGNGDLEFVEIFNPTHQPVPLEGWRLRLGAGSGYDFDFASGQSVGSGEAVVVVPFNPADAVKRAAFEDAHAIAGQNVTILGGFSPGSLSDAGMDVVLQRPDTPPAEDPAAVPYLTEDLTRWAPGPPWPASAAGGGDSLHRRGRALAGTFAESWEAAAPSPGRVSPATTLPEWAATWFPEGGPGSGPLDDFDADGWVNLFEYLFGTHPRITGSVPATTFTYAGGEATFSYVRDAWATDVTAGVRASPDGTAWSPVSSNTTTSPTGWETGTATAGSSPTQFFQLEAVVDGE